MKSDTLPSENGIPASTGEIQWMSGLAVQANQNNLHDYQRDSANEIWHVLTLWALRMRLTSLGIAYAPVPRPFGLVAELLQTSFGR